LNQINDIKTTIFVKKNKLFRTIQNYKNKDHGNTHIYKKNKKKYFVQKKKID